MDRVVLNGGWHDYTCFVSPGLPRLFHLTRHLREHCVAGRGALYLFHFQY